MKRIFVLFAVALVTSTMIWGQVVPPTPLINFNAVGTISTEARYSAALFDSDVDTFIDPAWHDPAIGTFMFLGGFPQAATVDATDPAYNTLAGKYKISIGYGKTLGKGKNKGEGEEGEAEAEDKSAGGPYFAVYYGGSLARGDGNKNQVTVGTDTKYRADSDLTWQNNLAMLLGIGSMGFRFDLIMDNARTEQDIYEGKVVESETTGDTLVALSWGALIGAASPYVTVGFKFPYQHITTDGDSAAGTEPKEKMTETSGATLGLRVGMGLDTSDTSTLSVDFGLDYVLPNSVSGDKERIAASTNPEYAGIDKNFTYGGELNFELNVGYTTATIWGNETIGTTTLKVKPNVALGLYGESTNNSAKKDKLPSNDCFSASPGLDLGIEYKYQKIGLYSGLGLRFFNFISNFHTGGDKDFQNDENIWELTGISWDSEKLRTGGNIGIGMTFEPTAGLVFGVSLTGWMNNLFQFNPQTMQFNTNNWGNTNGTFGAPNAAVDITVSYKY